MRLYHYTKNPLEAVTKTAVEQYDFDGKPKGLWLSDDNDYGWKNFCIDENFRIEKLSYRSEFEVDLTDVLWIKNNSELKAFSKKYTYNEEKEYVYFYIKWKDVAEKYKGILITPYLWNMRFDNQAKWYYGWDCASACIWDTSIVELISCREYFPEKIET